MSKKANKLKTKYTLLINNSISIPLGSLVYSIKRDRAMPNPYGPFPVSPISSGSSTIDLEVTFRAKYAKSKAFSKIVGTELNLKILNEATWQVDIEMHCAVLISYQEDGDVFTAKFRGTKDEGTSIGNGLVQAIRRIRNQRLIKRNIKCKSKK